MHSPAEQPDRQPRAFNIRGTRRAKEFAIELRKEMSPPERLLCSRLRGQQLGGLKFRKQHPMGCWIADFYCCEAALVVEVDGAGHQGERKELDAVRDEWMNQRHVGVLRFTGREVLGNLKGVLSTIWRAAEDRILQLNPHARETPPPSLRGLATPPPQSGGGADPLRGEEE